MLCAIICTQFNNTMEESGKRKVVETASLKLLYKYAHAIDVSKKFSEGIESNASYHMAMK